MSASNRLTSRTASIPSLDALVSCTCAPFAKPCSPKAKCRQTTCSQSYPYRDLIAGMGLSPDSIASLTATNPSVKNVTKREPNNKMKNEKQTNQPTYSIPTVSGKTIELKNLRPGDWVQFLPNNPLVGNMEYVISNTPSKGQIEIMSRLNGPFSWPYKTSTLPSIYTYLGRGQKRKWLAYLPKWLSRLFCPYSKPSK